MRWTRKVRWFWSDVVYKVSRFFNEDRALERQLEDQMFRQVQSERNEAEQKLERLNRKLRKMEKEEKKLEKKMRLREKKREIQQKTEQDWFRSRMNERQVVEKHLQLKRQQDVERESMLLLQQLKREREEEQLKRSETENLLRKQLEEVKNRVAKMERLTEEEKRYERDGERVREPKIEHRETEKNLMLMRQLEELQVRVESETRCRNQEKKLEELQKKRMEMAAQIESENRAAKEREISFREEMERIREEKRMEMEKQLEKEEMDWQKELQGRAERARALEEKMDRELKEKEEQMEREKRRMEEREKDMERKLEELQKKRMEMAAQIESENRAAKEREISFREEMERIREEKRMEMEKQLEKEEMERQKELQGRAERARALEEKMERELREKRRMEERDKDMERKLEEMRTEMERKAEERRREIEERTREMERQLGEAEKQRKEELKKLQEEENLLQRRLEMERMREEEVRKERERALAEKMEKELRAKEEDLERERREIEKKEREMERRLEEMRKEVEARKRETETKRKIEEKRRAMARQEETEMEMEMEKDWELQMKFAPDELFFRAADESTQRRGFRDRRAEVQTPETKEEKPETSSKGPRFLTVKHLNELLEDPEENHVEVKESSSGTHEDNNPQRELEEQPQNCKMEQLKKALLQPFSMDSMTEVEREREIEREQEKEEEIQSEKEEEKKQMEQEEIEKEKDRELDVQKVQEARREHMAREMQRKRELQKKRFSPGELFFKATGESTRRRGFRDRRAEVQTPETKEEKPEPENKKHLEEPVASSKGPRFIVVKPLNELPEEPEENRVEVKKSSSGTDEDNNPQREPEEQPQNCKTEKLKKALLRPFPMGRMTECCVERDRGDKNNPIYRLYRDEKDGKELVMVASKNRKQNTYKILLGESREGGAVLGHLTCNRKNTEFVLFKRNQHALTEIATIRYEKSFLGFRKNDEKTTVVLTSMDKKQEKSHLENKAPVWDEEQQEYILKFYGRARMASVKNFQLVNPNKPDRILMQFGRRDEDSFVLDYRFPFCALQAFAVALSCFDAKG